MASRQTSNSWCEENTARVFRLRSMGGRLRSAQSRSIGSQGSVPPCLHEQCQHRQQQHVTKHRYLDAGHGAPLQVQQACNHDAP